MKPAEAQQTATHGGSLFFPLFFKLLELIYFNWNAPCTWVSTRCTKPIGEH